MCSPLSDSRESEQSAVDVLQKKTECGRSVERGDMDLCVLSLELSGMLLFVGAWLCVLTTTLLPQWLTMSTALLPVESYELGLWETCVVQDVGGMECRAYDSLLGLPTDLKLARVLMCASLAVGMLGILVSVPGLHLVNSCSRAKRTLTTVGALLALLSGLLCLIPVSYMAHFAVTHFFDDKVPDVVPRWEFGDALFCGWTGGFLLMVAGLLLIASCWCWQTQPRPAAPQQQQQQQQQQRRYQTMNARKEYV
ncbi:putative claudin-24 [Solea solea]|uniref:putative claudin-24 n=1 Tax=Solea solea TaxID=90069 RepID=UPI00272D8FF7|nr:putative claudin-24 [Solea solea]